MLKRMYDDWYNYSVVNRLVALIVITIWVLILKLKLKLER